MRIKKITAEEVNIGGYDAKVYHPKWHVMRSRETALEYAAHAGGHQVYQLPNGAYAVRRPKSGTKGYQRIWRRSNLQF